MKNLKQYKFAVINPKGDLYREPQLKTKLLIKTIKVIELKYRDFLSPNHLCKKMYVLPSWVLLVVFYQ